MEQPLIRWLFWRHRDGLYPTHVRKIPWPANHSCLYCQWLYHERPCSHTYPYLYGWLAPWYNPTLTPLNRGCRKTTVLDNSVLKIASKCSFIGINSAFSAIFALPYLRSLPFATPSNKGRELSATPPTNNT